ncbi:MAG TPA: hypothetical protein EYP98_05245, partial [Planctomycetes bacterium]|nr:hypothetical protein [Planctomycetota bacterium]
MANASSAFPRHDQFLDRHIGPSAKELGQILHSLDCRTLEDLTEKAIPGSIRWQTELTTTPAMTERAALKELTDFAAENRVMRSYI